MMLPARFVVLSVALLATTVSRDLFAPTGAANVLVFVASDCPISNGYAPEIQRLCHDYRKKGVACTVVYEDASIDDAGVRAHREAYGYTDIPVVVDTRHEIAARAKVSVTPQVAVVGAGGAVKYRGRIDNKYEKLGQPRRVITAHDLREAIDAVLDGRPVARPETQAVGCSIPFGPPQASSH